MIKNYRNLLLATAIATLMGCNGQTDLPADVKDIQEDPVNNGLAAGGVKSQLTNRIIAQLLSSAFLQIIDATSVLNDAAATAQSKETTLGKTLSNAQSSPVQAALTGALAIDQNFTAESCSKGGTSDFIVKLVTALPGGTFEGPEFNDLFASFAKGPTTIAVGLVYDKCNEPVHKEYNPVDGSIVFEEENQISNGSLNVRLKATPGSVTDKDFSLGANITLKDFSVLKAKPIDMATAKQSYLSGDISASLKTGDSENFNANIGVELANTNPETNGFVKSAFSAKGTMKLTSNFEVKGYDLSAAGSLVDYKVSKNNSFVFYTTDNLT